MTRKYRRDWLSNGFDPSQQQLWDLLVAVGFEGRTVLEIGCGVGYFHQRMVADGAASAVGVDLSAAMLDEARKLAEESGTADRVRYHNGAYADVAEQAGGADITILDRVLCCDPRPDLLIGGSGPRTGSVFAVTYPHRNPLSRVGLALARVWFRLRGADFQPYLHAPARLDGLITDAGLVLHAEARTWMWRSLVFVRR